MTTTIGGSYPSVNSDSDATINGLTVGKGGGTNATNTALGASALAVNTSGDSNVALGASALAANTTGYANTSTGQLSLTTNTTGYFNTATGSSALRFNTTGVNNTAFGQSALYSNTTASNNTAVGFQAAYNNTTGAGNVYLGHQAGLQTTTGTQNVYVGLNAGPQVSASTGNYNVAIGQAAGRGITTGERNVGLGYESLYANTTGAYNVAVGMYSLNANTTASNNTAVGYQSLLTNTTGILNVAVGYRALYSTTTQNQNVAVGADAFYSNTTGYFGVAVGYRAGESNTTGFNNTFIGRDAGRYITTGSKNTIIGSYDGNQGGLDIRTASNYIVLSDGDGNPRQIIDNNGSMQFSTTTAVGADITGAGMWYSATAGFLYVASTGGNPVLAINRNTNDGTLVEFKQAATIEGTITVSGTTVSYNGGHLSRWSQFQTGGNPQVYRGTVLESTNDMCVWEKDGQVLPNEQSTKTIISTTAKSKAVAGVFDMYDLDDKDNPYDFFLAQSGDFVIRIAQGVVVENGDLLESAGDGTAQPQADDICRSSTIAKVTSNYVSATYADGSYCVPCILMIG